MSRIGKKPIDVPSNVKVEIAGNKIIVDGPKGKLEHVFPGILKVTKKEDKVMVERASDVETASSLQGLTHTIIANLIKGVTEGYAKSLEIRGVGFKAQAQGSTLQITLGFSHPINYAIPQGIVVATPKPTIINISGIDKVKVGEVAAEIRSYFKPEPYTGKGIRYVGEYVRHKAGKTVVK